MRKKVYIHILVFGLTFCSKLSLAQSSSSSNILTGTQTAPIQYLGSSSNHDVIFKSFNIERFRIVQADGTLKLSLTTNITSVIGGIKILGSQGQTAANPAYGLILANRALECIDHRLIR